MSSWIKKGRKYHQSWIAFLLLGQKYNCSVFSLNINIWWNYKWRQRKKQGFLMLLSSIKRKTLCWLADALNYRNKLFPSFLEWRIKDRTRVFRAEFYRIWFMEIMRIWMCKLYQLLQRHLILYLAIRRS